jgi:hypothetical protein
MMQSLTQTTFSVDEQDKRDNSINSFQYMQYEGGNEDSKDPDKEAIDKPNANL